MPPRRRNQKVGLKRMDAAVENMRLLGFPDEVVRSTIKRLLQVYDGDAGWLFIEEASYKLLIDTILDEQETSLLKGHLSDGSTKDVENNEQSAAMSSTEVVEPICSNMGTVDRASQTDEMEGEDCNPLAEAEIRNEKDTGTTAHHLGDAGISTRHLGDTLHSNHMIPLSVPIVTLPPQKRRRFYGWISSDHKFNDNDTIQCIPATLRQQSKLLLGTDLNSRSRWDERPEHL